MNEHEPIHVHISKAGKEAQFDLVPEIDLTYCRGFKANELRNMVSLLVEHYDTFINAWQQTFGK